MLVYPDCVPRQVVQKVIIDTTNREDIVRRLDALGFSDETMMPTAETCKACEGLQDLLRSNLKTQAHQERNGYHKQDREWLAGRTDTQPPWAKSEVMKVCAPTEIRDTHQREGVTDG